MFRPAKWTWLGLGQRNMVTMYLIMTQSLDSYKHWSFEESPGLWDPSTAPTYLLTGPACNHFLLYSRQLIDHLIAAFQNTWGYAWITGSWLRGICTNSCALLFIGKPTVHENRLTYCKLARESFDEGHQASLATSSCTICTIFTDSQHHNLS